MRTWHRSRKTTVGLRVVGMALCGLAWASITRLASYPPDSLGLIAYLLAGLGMISMSAGGALTFLGPRLFTPVRVSARWRHNRAAPSRPADAWHHSLPRDASAVPELPGTWLTPEPAAAVAMARRAAGWGAAKVLKAARA